MGINIPGFIRYLREGSVNEAYSKIRESNCLASICGRICSAPCEKACILNKENAPINIRALERFAGDFGKDKVTRLPISKDSKKIAIIGSGPCGLYSAWALIKKGYRVTVFESLEKPGGVLRYGVPEFRIPKRVLDSDINDIKIEGLEIVPNCFFGQTLSFDDLLQNDFKAILIATGAAIPKYLDIPGVNLAGVYYGEEFLMRVNLMKSNIFSRQIPTFPLGNKIAIIGSGNTALDCARASVRLGREVTLIFRRSEDEMRVKTIERDYAKEEGIKFEPLTRPIEVLASNKNFVKGLKCVRLDYTEQDESGKWQLEEVPDSQFTIEADTIVVAVGHRPNSNIQKFYPSIELDEDGSIMVDADTGMTSLNGVFAAGNVVTNAQPLIRTLGAGKDIADKIDNYLKAQKK